MAGWIDPTNEEISNGAEAVVKGHWQPYFPKTVLTIDWIDDQWQPEEENHVQLLGFWKKRCQENPIGKLTKDDIDPCIFKTFLRYVLLLDVEDDGFDARYRVYGTGVASFSGRDWTGYLVSEMNREAKLDVALFYRSTYLAITQQGVPLYTHHMSMPSSTPKSWKRLVVPVFDTEGTSVQKFLVCNLPLKRQPLA